MNKYYVNDKQVNYTLFKSYLLQVCKHIAFKELTCDTAIMLVDKGQPTEKNIIKLANEYYFDYYNDMKNNGLIYTIEKITFKVVKGVE